MKLFFRHSRKGSALLIAMIVTILLSLLVMGFLDKVLRIGKNVKAIEQSTQAYYLATGLAEVQLRDTAELKKQPWTIQDKTEDLVGVYSGAVLVVHTGSNIIPAMGKGNSPFDSTKEWNIMSLDSPVQIVIPHDMDWANVRMQFRVPNISKTGNTTEIRGATQSGYILWAIGNGENVQFANSGALFTGDDVNISGNSPLSISSKNGFYYMVNNVTGNLEQQTKSLGEFYNQVLGGQCHNYACTLKLSMIQPMEVQIGGKNHSNFPFLEYKIDFATRVLPEQFMTLTSMGKVGGYQRVREILVPQITSNTALDFAVLQ